MKICSKCGIEKDESNFSKHGQLKSGLRPDCKVCVTAYYENNKEKAKLASKKTYLKNREKCLEQSKKWRENNRERYNEIASSRHKERIKSDLKYVEQLKIIKQNYRNKHHGTPKFHIAEKISYWKRKYPLIESNLTVEYLVELYNKQKGLCYYTAQKMAWEKQLGMATKNTPSLDRLTPDKGYVKGNVVWCCYFVNTMKGNLSEQEFYNYMSNILKIKSINNE